MPLNIVLSGYDDYLSGSASIKALIMGWPGAGKTRSASYWPKPIFADCERGRMSLADRKVPVATINDSKDMDALLLVCRQESTKPLQQRKFQTLVIDTFDAYQRKLMQQRLKEERKAEFSGGDDWGWLEAKTVSLIERLQNLDMNVVVNLHVQEKKDGDVLVLSPLLKASIKDQITGEFDLVGYMSAEWGTEDGERVLKRSIRWAPDPHAPMLKDRSGAFPKLTPVNFDENDYGQLLAAITVKAESLTDGEHVMTLPVEGDDAPDPVGPLTGGPVEPKPEVGPKKAAPRKAGASPAPLAPPPVKKVEPTEEPAQDAATSVADTPAADIPPAAPTPTEPTHEEAVQNVVEGLGGEVISETPTVEDTSTDAPAPTPDTAESCGTGTGPYIGCGKSLDGEDVDRVGLSFIKYRNKLCSDCYGQAKAGTLQKKD